MPIESRVTNDVGPPQSMEQGLVAGYVIMSSMKCVEEMFPAATFVFYDDSIGNHQPYCEIRMTDGVVIHVEVSHVGNEQRDLSVQLREQLKALKR